jgi:tetratricopeptide (TPR) repeat protein
MRSDAPAPDLSQLVTHMRAQRYEEVERMARQLLIHHPNSGIVWKFLGVSLGLQAKDALPALAKAASLLSNDAESHANLGNALRVAGHLDQAVGSYRRALDIRPDFAEARLALADSLRILGQLDGAVASYRRALSLVPDRADAHGNLGIALDGLGELDAAVASYRRALEIEPHSAEIHSNVGIALLKLRQLPEALAHFRRALEFNPDLAAAHTNLGNAFRDLGQLDEAVACHRRALALQPDLAEAGINLGNVLRDLGQFDAAIVSYRRVLEIDPHSAPAHCDLGGAFRDLGRLGDAERSFRQALLLKPDYAPAHSHLGVVLRLQNRMPEAEASCRRAREIDPNLATAIVLAAELHADSGQFAAAEQLFKRATEIEPSSAQAWAGIAGLRKMTVNDAAWLSEVQRVLSRPLPNRDEALLRYAIGKYLDDLQDYPQAFTNYRRANELAQLCTPKYDRQFEAQAVSGTIHRYDRRWMSESAGTAAAAARPVFVVGMPRSGTSLVEQILASHPTVFGAGELPYWSQAAANYESSLTHGEVRDSPLGTLARDYLRHLDGLAPDALRVVDKMPSNFLFLGLIHAALPGARIIHVRRNPIDTCLSIYFQNFDVAHPYANNLEDLAHYYTQYLRLMQHWSATLPKEAMMEVPYEGLTAAPEAWSRKMVEFIGLPWDSRCLDFNQTNRAVVTRSRWQVRQSISRTSVERWRNYKDFIGPLLSLGARVSTQP